MMALCIPRLPRYSAVAERARLSQDLPCGHHGARERLRSPTSFLITMMRYWLHSTSFKPMHVSSQPTPGTEHLLSGLRRGLMHTNSLVEWYLAICCTTLIQLSVVTQRRTWDMPMPIGLALRNYLLCPVSLLKLQSGS